MSPIATTGNYIMLCVCVS